MDTRKISNIFDYLNHQRVSPVYSVPFCLRLHGKKLNEISKTAGVTRGFFYQALVGKRNPNERMKRELEALGINPWGIVKKG